MTLRFDASRLYDVLSAFLDSGMTYDLGGKIGTNRTLDQVRASRQGIDCSGFTKYVLHYASNGALNLRGGTMMQYAALEDDGYVSCDEADFAFEQSQFDDHLRIGFRNTTFKRDEEGKLVRDANNKPKREQIGHVWLVINGLTFESSKRNGGDGPMVSNVANLRTDTDRLYTLGPVHGFGMRSGLGFWFLPELAETTPSA